jgi:hypothetical protein
MVAFGTRSARGLDCQKLLSDVLARTADSTPRRMATAVSNLRAGVETRPRVREVHTFASPDVFLFESILGGEGSTERLIRDTLVSKGKVFRRLPGEPWSSPADEQDLHIFRTISLGYIADDTKLAEQCTPSQITGRIDWSRARSEGSIKLRPLMGSAEARFVIDVEPLTGRVSQMTVLQTSAEDEARSVFTFTYDVPLDFDLPR